MNIGDHISISGFIGRLSDVRGGIYQLTTPHGSVIDGGFAWVRPLTPEQEIMLAKYDRAAAELNEQKELKQAMEHIQWHADFCCMDELTHATKVVLDRLRKLESEKQ